MTQHLFNTADSRKTEIVTIRQRDRAIETKRVSEDWYHQLQTARREKQRMSELLKDTKGSSITAIVPDGDEVDGRWKPVVMGIAEGPRDDAQIAAERHGVGVQAVDQIPIEFKDCWQQEYQTVPGGVALNRQDMVPADSYYTATCRVYNNSDEPRMLTCRHGVALPCDESDQEGTTVEQWGDDFGTVADADPNLDAMTIEVGQNSGRDGISNTIEGHIDDYPVGAYYTRDSIADAVNSSPWSQYGCSTCDTNPEIYAPEVDFTLQCQAPDGSTSSIQMQDQVLREQVAQGGDSGGPWVGIYPINIPHTVVAGMVNGSTVVNNTPVDFGTAAFAIQRDLDVSFGPFRAR
ncbi:hypothetical protein SAMN05192554_1591 [Haloarchaeobius iranensis]|uniref:Trypsin n=2 Tax=Haloarchaeobius iranensis TaxID=996166 RepID=A0A1H0C5A0_9EURY|nr:hypothetical protein SAMN05192554_1591 [Haloarchaeobius iranensis]